MNLVFFRRVKKDQKGFSLVELMVVVAIIGILAALAVPRFQTFQAKARQSEAKTNLSHIYTLQQAYYGENTAYAAQAKIGPATNNCVATSAIGFQLSDCAKVRYDYESTGAATTFTATAENLKTDRKVNPTCPNNDKWQINETKALSALKDAATCI